MASICSSYQHCCDKMHIVLPSQCMNSWNGRYQGYVWIKSSIIDRQVSLRSREYVQVWKISSKNGTFKTQQPVLAVLEDLPFQSVAKHETYAGGVETPVESREELKTVVKRRARANHRDLEEGLSFTTTAGSQGEGVLKGFEAHGFTRAEIREGMKTDECSLYLGELGVEMPSLAKCFDHSRNAPKDRWRYVLTVLEEFGMSTNELVTLITKDPSILGASPIQMKQLLRFSVEQGLDCAVVTSMSRMWPGLLFLSVDHVKEVIHYFTSVGLYRDELFKIIKQRPQLLGHHVDRIRYVVDTLLEYGVPAEELPRIVRKAPELFSNLTYSSMSSNLDFLVSMGLDAGSLGKAVARRPNLLNYSLENMKRAVQYLGTFIKLRDVPKLIKRYAEVLVLDPARKMQPMIDYLLELGVKPQDIGKVIMRRPQLLGYTIPGLEPSVNCLLEFGVKREMIGKVVTTAPQILTLNVEDKLRPVVDFFRTMGLNKERDIELLLVRNGQILCCSIEKNLRPKFKFLLGLGLSTVDIANMIVLFPSMLGQSIEGSLAPKYDYLVNVMKRSVDEVIDFPQYFGYSLERRIIPRHEKLHEKAISASLPSMLACVDHDFELRYMMGKAPTRAPYKARRKTIS
ncbi:hypothetical protein R1flu_020337 [Riccia fluitans]|uniref:Mitochondrial transcription termination factor n=1 Tax=Riccia fluitans TaxID=41844 RepID=A0ABD1ZPR6_9MARC